MWGNFTVNNQLLTNYQSVHIIYFNYPLPPPVTFCHKKDNPLPLSERDIIYEWPLRAITVRLKVVSTISDLNI